MFEILLERVLANRELVSEVIRVKSFDGRVWIPVMLFPEVKAGRERMKICEKGQQQK